MSVKTAGWTEQDVAKVVRMRDSRKSWETIAAALGRSVRAVQNTFYRAKEKLKPAAQPAAHNHFSPPEETVVEVDPSLDLEELKRARKSAASRNGVKQPTAQNFVMEKFEDPMIPQSELWQRVEEENAQRIQREMASREFRIKFPTDWILLSCMSDLHIACANTVDMRRMREDAELIRDTPNCYALLGGDVVDNHIKHRAAMLSARSRPSDQWLHFEYLLEIMGPKIAVAVAGNHDLWTDQFAGTDVLGMLMKKHRFTSSAGYQKFEARIYATVGEQLYRIGLRHQFRMNSSFNATHSIKQWHRLGEFDFDIGIQGHTHEAALESYFYRGRQCWAAKPGAYQITSAHSAQYGWNDSVPMCPTFLLSGDKRMIVGFQDIRHALATMNLLN